MTTTSLRFADPLDGGSWPFSGRLTSAQANAMIAAIRAIDAELARRGVRNWVQIGASARYGLVAQEAAGELIGIGSTSSYTSPRAVVSPYSATASATLPGSITVTAAAPSAYSSSLERAIVVNAGLSYRTGAGDTTLGSGVTLPGSITTAGDVVWSVGGAQFVVVGTASGTSGQIGYSAAGASWSSSTGVPSTDAAWGGTGLLATDGASGVLAVPSDVNNPSIWYSADGGDTFTKYATGITTTSDLRGPCYDTYRGQWLVGLKGSYVYGCTNPTSGVWALRSALPSGFSIEGLAALPDGRWVAMGDDGLIESTDAGSTWAKLGSALTGTRLLQVDGRLAIVGGSSSWISGLY
jgi:hypothetical protein